MADLVLINPGGREVNYQWLGGDLMAVEPPLWCRLIAGYCRDHGHSVRIIDAEAEDMSPQHVAERVVRYNPDLIGMIVYGHQPNASTQQMAPASDICRAIKAMTTIPIIIAGGHVSVLPEKTLREEAVDFVAIGEGAVTIESLLTSRSNKDLIQGLAWLEKAHGSGRKDGLYPDVLIKYNQNQPAHLLSPQELHGNVWDLLPMGLYRAHNWQTDARQPYASIYTSLGCPFKCVFCCINAPFGGPGYRTRTPADVVAEVDLLYRQYGVKTFKIIDEMFVLKPAHYLAICEGLAALPYASELNFWAYARIDTVRPETLSLLRKAGIRWLALGIESGSAHVRDGALKKIDQQDIFDTVKAIQDADIKVIGNFIFGLPDDTIESMQETLDMALTLGCDFVNFYAAQAYPGSRLFTETSPKDLPETWSGYSQHGYETRPLPTATLTSVEVLAFRDRAHRTYFKGNDELTRPLKRRILESV